MHVGKILILLTYVQDDSDVQSDQKTDDGSEVDLIHLKRVLSLKLNLAAASGFSQKLIKETIQTLEHISLT